MSKNRLPAQSRSKAWKKWPVDESVRLRVQQRGWKIQFANVVAVGAFLVSLYSLHVAERQNEITQLQLEATDRPWIKVLRLQPREDMSFFKISSNLEQKQLQTQANLVVDVVAKNVGHSVAEHVVLKGHMTFANEPEELIFERDAACSEAPRYTFPINLFPDEDTASTQFIIGAEIVPPSDPKRMASVGGLQAPVGLPPNAWIASPKFVGCLDYTIANSGTVHHTKFVYGVGHHESIKEFNNFSYYPIYFHVGQDIPKDKLVIEPELSYTVLD